MPEQFDFCQNLSTFDALKEFSEKIYSTLDSKHSFLSIVVDFSKAFDTVRDDILSLKLKLYGICGIVHDWSKDYFTNRT